MLKIVGANHLRLSPCLARELKAILVISVKQFLYPVLAQGCIGVIMLASW